MRITMCEFCNKLTLNKLDYIETNPYLHISEFCYVCEECGKIKHKGIEI